jgi:hypothetical protein
MSMVAKEETTAMDMKERAEKFRQQVLERGGVGPRARRGLVVGRKNHYGSRSRCGTEVAALFYSLLETAKLCGVDPMRCLRAAAMVAPG